MKFTDAELESWGELLDAMSSGGPRPHEAHALLWLVEQECKRRGIPWPGDDGGSSP